MRELIKAVKAAIESLDLAENPDDLGIRALNVIAHLRAAVDKADNLPSDFHEWYTSPDSCQLSGSYQDALETWYCAQQAAIRVERERIKQIITYQFGELVSDLSEVMEMIDDD